jgi:hypothetical protein
MMNVKAVERPQPNNLAHHAGNCLITTGHDTPASVTLLPNILISITHLSDVTYTISKNFRVAKHFIEHLDYGQSQISGDWQVINTLSMVNNR